MLALAMTSSPTVSVPLAFTSFRKFAAVRRCCNLRVHQDEVGHVCFMSPVTR